MTYAPMKLLELAAYWKRQGGINLGIVGDTDHATRGVSYHLGKDQLIPGAYSTLRPRDRAGLTNAASAIDLGKLDGSYPELRKFSDWLARRWVKGFAGTNDVVEVIYSPDGKRVLGFKDGIDFLIPDYGDASHLTHTHISFYRDSENRNKTALFAPYFTEDEMLGYTLDRWYYADVAVKIDGAAAVRLDDGTLIALKKGERKTAIGHGKLTKPLGSGSGDQADRQTGYLLAGERPAWLLAYAADIVG